MGHSHKIFTSHRNSLTVSSQMKKKELLEDSIYCCIITPYDLTNCCVGERSDIMPLKETSPHKFAPKVPFINDVIKIWKFLTHSPVLTFLWLVTYTLVSINALTLPPPPTLVSFTQKDETIQNAKTTRKVCD